MKPDLHKQNRFIIRVGRILMGHGELSGSSSMDYRKADLTPWEILDQVKVFFQFLDQHIIEKRRQPA